MDHVFGCLRADAAGEAEVSHAMCQSTKSERLSSAEITALQRAVRIALEIRPDMLERQSADALLYKLNRAFEVKVRYRESKNDDSL